MRRDFIIVARLVTTSSNQHDSFSTRLPGMNTTRKAPGSPGSPKAGSDDAVVLEGTVDRITFESDAKDFCVFRFAVEGRRDPVVVVGNLHDVQVGQTMRLRGRFETDRRYGKQFRASSYEHLQPSTLAGIEKYLGSGLIPGIGPALAERLVARFGQETLDVIESRPDRLLEVEGIGRVRSEQIRKAFLEQRAIRDLLVFLQSHGVSSALATRIYRQYRERALRVVRENPYRLAAEVPGIGFKTADELAQKLGIARDSPFRAQGGVCFVLTDRAEAGHVAQPHRALVETTSKMLGVDPTLVEEAIDELARTGTIVVEPIEDGERAVYLRPLHTAEVLVAQRLARLAKADETSASPSLDVERELSWFESTRNIQLADEQRDAIRRAILGKVMVLTGGPGTGKTTIVNGILRILDKQGLRIALTAPTGRAAKRLTETTGREAKTVHRLLEVHPKLRTFQRNEQSPLDADLVIVDEASMLDLPLMQHLLAAIPPKAKLVLVGDVDQLPSVGPGSVLADAIRSGVIEVARLTRIFRQAGESLIVTSAHRIQQGLLPVVSKDASGDFFFIERDEPESILATLKTLLEERIPKRFGLDPIDDVQVLTPMHKGLLGASHLNQELQRWLNRSTSKGLERGARMLRVSDKVMQVRNNYELDVYNGDIGRIESIDEAERAIEVRYDGRLVRYETGDLDDLTLAYACSIHKSQGSEYPAVVLPLHTQHFVMLERNLLYTAITRGKRLVVVVGSRRALELAVKKTSSQIRFSRLAERLRASVG